ncbi:hypothetical protein BGZ76_008873 [Entomortierella beljakovae]|nr:hypothetical protein BGZ76_008873 [Entomortierella beljakovae]
MLQWTGEKMGKNPKARMDEDFHSLTSETEAKRVALEKLGDTSQAYFKAISKRVEGDDKHKGLAVETFGMSMCAQSYTVREGSYQTALRRMGDAHQNIGVAQQDLISKFESTYMDNLKMCQAQMKEYQTLQKKLSSRRQDYDAKLAKVQKAKKEKPEWEEEMQAAKAKYEETRENVLTIMNAITESQDESLGSLKSYHEAQLSYARKMVMILEAIPDNTFTPSSPNGSRISLYAGNGISRKLSRQNSQDPDDEYSNHSDDQSSTQSIPNGRQPFDRTPSSADLRRNNQSQHLNPELSRSMSHLTPNAAQARKGTGGAATRTSAFVAPSIPVPRGRQQKQVRALFTFDATAEGELSIQKGDIIRIVEEIDEGWWEGELVDANGVRHTGMFPSNYCEEVISDSGSTHRQGSINSNSSEGRYADEDQAAYYERESEPTVHYTEPEEEIVVVAAPRRAPPPPCRQTTFATNAATNGASANGHLNGGSSLAAPSIPISGMARATPPTARPTSTIAPLARSSTLGTRMPPPPPPTRRAAVESMRHSAVFAGQSNAAVSPPAMVMGGVVGPSPPPTAVPSTPNAGSMMGYIPKDYFSNQSSDHAESEVGPCRDCQCVDFQPNVFKRGSCNNCFHCH